MGSGRDKRKAAKEKKAGPSVGRGQEKTDRKTQKNEVRKSEGRVTLRDYHHMGVMQTIIPDYHP